MQRRPPPLRMGRGWSTRIMLLPHHTKLGRGRTRSNRVGVDRGTNIFLDAEPCPLGRRMWLTPIKCFCRTSWSFLVKLYEQNYGDTPEKCDPSRPVYDQCHSRSLEPICDRPATSYDCMLVIHSNHRPISFRFRENGDFGQKSQIFPTPCI